VLSRETIVQVPVNYHPRVGTSTVTGHTGKAISLGLEMLRMVLAMRVRPPRRQPPPPDPLSNGHATPPQPQPLRNPRARSAGSRRAAR